MLLPGRNRLLFITAVQQFDPKSKGHGEIDIALIYMCMMDRVQPFKEKTESHHEQKGQRKDLERRPPADKIGYFLGKEEHDDHGDDHGSDHDSYLAGESHGRDDAVEGKDGVYQDDLTDNGAKGLGGFTDGLQFMTVTLQLFMQLLYSLV